MSETTKSGADDKREEPDTRAEYERPQMTKKRAVAEVVSISGSGVSTVPGLRSA